MLPIRQMACSQTIFQLPTFLQLAELHLGMKSSFHRCTNIQDNLRNDVCPFHRLVGETVAPARKNETQLFHVVFMTPPRS